MGRKYPRKHTSSHNKALVISIRTFSVPSHQGLYREWLKLERLKLILSRGRCALHLAVLEALYIRKLDPELCVQKENVLSLQLFGVTPRRGGNNVT